MAPSRATSPSTAPMKTSCAARWMAYGRTCCSTSRATGPMRCLRWQRTSAASATFSSLPAPFIPTSTASPRARRTSFRWKVSHRSRSTTPTASAGARRCSRARATFHGRWCARLPCSVLPIPRSGLRRTSSASPTAVRCSCRPSHTSGKRASRGSRTSASCVRSPVTSAKTRHARPTTPPSRV